MSESERTVWLLGSGFSKPLGGPLLRDLFRQETKEDVLPFFPEDTFPDLAESLPWVQCCFKNGVSEGRWDNAEQFLAFVDDAYAGSSVPRRELLANLIERSDPVPQAIRSNWAMEMPPKRFFQHQAYKKGLPNAFDRTVKRALASECSRFVMTTDPKAEAYLPYREWVKALEPGRDTIVTFNYDRVIETTVVAVGLPNKFHVVMPKHLPLERCVPVLKLHGSVDWRLKPTVDKSVLAIEDAPVSPAEILRSREDDIAMAAPGGSKSRFVDIHLSLLWGAAEDALTAATRLMIIGYSFPDTDPGAQYRLLNAFAKGRHPSRSVHVVLGKGDSPESRRMLSLIRSTAQNRDVYVTDHFHTGPGVNIIQHPLGAQDLIGRFAAFTG